MTNLTDLIATACDLKQQMNDHIGGLYGRITQPAAFDKEKADAGKVLMKQYAPRLRDILAACSVEELTERRDKLDRSLNKGWAYCHLHPADTAAYDAWEARLLEYTVLEDALNTHGVITGTLERLEWIEQFVAPMEQRSLV